MENKLKKLVLKKETLRSLNQDIHGGASFEFSDGTYLSGWSFKVSDGGDSNSSTISIVVTSISIGVASSYLLSAASVSVMGRMAIRRPPPVTPTVGCVVYTQQSCPSIQVYCTY